MHNALPQHKATNFPSLQPFALSATTTVRWSHAMASITTTKRFKAGKSTTADQVLQGLDLTGTKRCIVRTQLSPMLTPRACRYD